MRTETLQVVLGGAQFMLAPADPRLPTRSFFGQKQGVTQA
jgi:hypothetical protein